MSRINHQYSFNGNGMSRRVATSAYKITLLFYLTLLSSTIFAQTTTLRGKVLDPKQQPIAYATVVVAADSLLTHDIRYAITNSSGEFVVKQIAKTSPELWLSIRSIGFIPYLHRFAQHDFPSSLTITLPEESVDVKDVVIIAQAPDMYEKGDTIVYNPKSYTQGDEHNIGEVINQMPGMNVDKSGKVYFQGKEVDKVLVNNEDIFSRSTTGIAINTLPPDFANSVELLQNYKAGDDIASEFRNEKMTALNLKSEKRLTLNGSVEGAGGIINKFEGKASLLSLLPKGSASTMLNSNNTGEPVFSIEDYFTQNADVESLLTGKGDNMLRLTPQESELINPPSNEYDRTAGLANINVTLKPTKQYKLKSSTLYNRSRAYGLENSLQHFFTTNGRFTNKHQGSEQKDIQLISQSLTNKWLPNRRFSLQSDTKFSVNDLDNVLDDRNDYLSRALNAQHTSTKRTFEIKENLEAQWLLKRGILFFGAKFAFNNHTHTSELLSSDPVLPFTYEPRDATWYRLQPQRKKQNTEYRAYIGTIYPLLWDILLTGEMAYQGNHTHLRQKINNDRATETLLLHELHPYVGLMKNINIFRFTLGSYFSYYQLQTSPYTLRANSRFYVEPKATLKLEFTTHHNITLSAQRTHSPSVSEQLSRLPWITSYRLYTTPSVMQKPFIEQTEFKLEYNYVSLFNNFIFFAYSSYALLKDNGRSVIQTQDLTSYRYYTDGGKSKHFLGSLHMTKGLGALPIDIKISAQIQLSSENIKRETMHDEWLSTNLISSDAGFFSRFRHTLFNFGIQGKYTRNNNKLSSQDAITSSHDEVTGRASLRFRWKDFNATLAGDYSFVIEDKLQRDVYDIDVNMTYKIGNFDLGLRAKNILHLRKNEWWESTADAIMFSKSLYRRMPGYILISLRLKF